MNLKTGSDVLIMDNRKQYDKYLSEISIYKPFSKEEERLIFEEYLKEPTLEIEQKICKHNLLFVVSVARYYAKKIKSNSITVNDFINEGNIGLIRAIKLFKNDDENRFLTYAIYHIRGNILKCINANIKQIRIPTSLKKEISFFKTKHFEFEQKNGCLLSISEVLRQMSDDETFKNKENFLEELFNLNKFEISLNSKAENRNDDNNAELIDLLVSDVNTPVDELIFSERKKMVGHFLKMLPIDKVRYVEDFFGIKTNHPLNYKEIALKYSKSPQFIKTCIDKQISYLNRKNRGLKNIFKEIS